MRIIRICQQCRRKFKVDSSREDIKNCSRKCGGLSRKGINFISQEGLLKLKEINSKENHPQWKGGITWDKKYQANQHKEYRHRLGISKKYRSDCNVSKTKEYRQSQRQKRRALEYGGGELSIETIQRVYEDNIKHYGTLTCYLCEQPIGFGIDHLEHKIPLCRSGTNKYNNLAIACQKCNCKKHTKTEEEYRKLEV